MKVTLIRHTEAPEELFADAAAICVGSSKGSINGMRSAIRSGHESLLEHASFTFLVEGVSRVLLAQLTRHRHASYSVESQRYAGVNYELVVPRTMSRSSVQNDMLALISDAREVYGLAMTAEVPSEDARYLTLHGATTKLMLTMNARELKHFFALRCCTRAQWEIRELANQMLELVHPLMPEVFKPHMAACDQSGFCREDKTCGRKPTLKSLLAKQSITELRDAVYEDANEHGLWDDLKKRANLSVEYIRHEAGMRIGEEVQELLDAANDPTHFAEELADVVIMALSTAGLLGIDIEKAVLDKMAMNKKRPYQHKEV